MKDFRCETVAVLIEGVVIIRIYVLVRIFRVAACQIGEERAVRTVDESDRALLGHGISGDFPDIYYIPVFILYLFRRCGESVASPDGELRHRLDFYACPEHV